MNGGTHSKVLLGVLGGVLMGGLFGALLGTAAVSGTSDQKTTASPTPSYAESLERRYDCWTEVAPADMNGKLPGGVVVQYGRSAPRHETSDQAVGAALEHVFNGTHPQLTVLAFCRR
ncbi:MAG: hypothetical protein J2P22_04790 [Nocardioides sp.]|nr:hypothetical protein [Nocardioides sp.]